jgi:hypothetical protein
MIIKFQLLLLCAVDCTMAAPANIKRRCYSIYLDTLKQAPPRPSLLQRPTVEYRHCPGDDLHD